MTNLKHKCAFIFSSLSIIENIYNDFCDVFYSKQTSLEIRGFVNNLEKC